MTRTEADRALMHAAHLEALATDLDKDAARLREQALYASADAAKARHVGLGAIAKRQDAKAGLFRARLATALESAEKLRNAAETIKQSTLNAGA